MGLERISMSINLGVRKNMWASMPQIDVQTGVKHGHPADSQVEKSGSPQAILGVRMPGLPLILYTGIRMRYSYYKYSYDLVFLKKMFMTVFFFYSSCTFAILYN